MTRVLIAVDETEESIRAAEVAHELFGDAAEYLAVSVADTRLDPATMPWWGAGWGTLYPVPYGAVWPYRVARSAEVSEAAAGRPGDDVPDERRRVDDATDEARAVAQESGLPAAEAVGEVGDPADAILRAAEERAVDVVVVGTRDRSWFDRLLEPSVSRDVVRRSEIPVLVVK